MLRDIERAYDAAGNGGRMDGRLGEFWAVIARFRVAFENGGLRSGGRFDWDAWAEQELTKVGLSSFIDLSAPNLFTNFLNCVPFLDLPRSRQSAASNDWYRQR
jgi:hypothetical protein